MIRYILFLACCVCAFSQLRGQEPTFVLSLQQAVKADRLVVDELGNIYLMTATSIERRNAVGNGVFRTSEMQWGEFQAIDVTDPLRPFVHFPSAGKIVFLITHLALRHRQSTCMNWVSIMWKPCAVRVAMVIGSGTGAIQSCFVSIGTFPNDILREISARY